MLNVRFGVASTGVLGETTDDVLMAMEELRETTVTDDVLTVMEELRETTVLLGCIVKIILGLTLAEVTKIEVVDTFIDCTDVLNRNDDGWTERVTSEDGNTNVVEFCTTVVNVSVGSIVVSSTEEVAAADGVSVKESSGPIPDPDPSGSGVGVGVLELNI